MPLSLIPATDPILWTPAAEVTDIPSQVLPFIDEMKALMAEHGGIGLAAPQVGISRTFFLASFRGNDSIWVIINPRTLDAKGWNTSALEGCLSFPGRQTYVPRLGIVKAEWVNENGVEMGNVLVGPDARVWLHEAAHCQGECIFPRPEAPAASAPSA